MKKQLALILAIVMCVAMVMAGCGSKPAESSSSAAPAPDASAPAGSAEPAPAAPAAGFTPEKDIDWIVTSSPGGGSDIYTRMISDIMTKQGTVGKTFLVTNKTDGGGEVGRAQVSQTKSGKQADHTLLTFNSGDLMPMLLNTPNRIENFTPIALMAVDKQLLFAGPKGTYTDFKSIIDAVKGGTVVTMGGSKGDDVATYEALIAELGVTETELQYITYDGTGDAITALLGGHIDVLISKPAASSQYVEEGVDASKRLTPILALSQERYAGNLADAPTLSEVDPAYENVEVPVWRGVIGPKDMSPEAAAYWSAQLKAVSESDQWATEYLDKNKLISNYMDQDQAKEFMTQFQADFMAANDIK